MTREANDDAINDYHVLIEIGLLIQLGLQETALIVFKGKSRGVLSDNTLSHLNENLKEYYGP